MSGTMRREVHGAEAGVSARLPAARNARWTGARWTGAR